MCYLFTKFLAIFYFFSPYDAEVAASFSSADSAIACNELRLSVYLFPGYRTASDLRKKSRRRSTDRNIRFGICNWCFNFEVKMSKFK